jgi:hypothetical protein
MNQTRFATWTFRVLASLLVVGLVVVGGARPASSAKGDTLNCSDFNSQAEAQAELDRTYPDDPNNLDGDNNGVACEDEFNLTADEIAAITRAGQSSDNQSSKKSSNNAKSGRKTETTPEPSPTETVTAEPAPETTPEPTPTLEDMQLPPDILNLVDGCAVISISARDVAAAGCPGAGTVVFSVPPGEPDLTPGIVIAPEANQQTGATAPVAHATVSTSANAPAKSSSNGSTSKNKNNGKNDNTKNNTKNSGGKNKNKSKNNKNDNKNNKNGKHKNKKNKNNNN